MTIQKQLSHLSFAAIVLVFAALPALAQTGSVDNQTVVATTSNFAKADQMAALRKALSGTSTRESTIVVAPAITEKQQPSFSVNQFVKSATESTATSNNTVFEFTNIDKPGKAFNETSSKAITFVPSRGPKMPWQ
jgi:hypothetical protein